MTVTKPLRRSLSLGLSARLLVLTVFFVMLAEVLIFVPSISRFRVVYLEEHVTRARLAMLALEGTYGAPLGAEAERRLLLHSEAYGIALRPPNRRVLLVGGDMPPAINVTFDLREGNFLMLIADAFAALGEKENRIMRVIGTASTDPLVVVEVLLDETPMREAMYAYAGRILQLSVVISLITAGLVYVSLQWLLVRPVRHITESMVAFREFPEDDSRTIVPSRRADEVGVAERELAVMQEQLRAALHQKTRLATLGAAVAKINHDLRNTLATAVLVSDRLADIDDPEVKRVTPRLMTAIDRAIDLCGQTLKFAADAGPKLQRSRFTLTDVVAEVAQGIRLDWRIEVPSELRIDGDREQIFRVLGNLGRNAEEAGAGRIRVSADIDDGHIVIDFADNGSGLPPISREKLFQPFAGSTRQGGTGLGLVIARDILHAHGGGISLAETGETGTVFRLQLPLIRDANHW
jgi:signal transduction histidine kinase